MHQGSRSISVVIPNFNGKGLLQKNLPSVFECLQDINNDWEIIVVDDCSTDDSVEFIGENYPEIVLLANEQNMGFSPTIDKGIFHAKYELVLALNSDIKLQKGYFLHQFKYFEKTDTFGVIGRMLDYDTHVLMEAGRYPAKRFLKFNSTINYLSEDTKEWLPTLQLSGANALMQKTWT
jgi:GT2 family glycosyltransferase